MPYTIQPTTRSGLQTQNSVILFPVPAKNTVYIDLGMEEALTVVEITDLSGHRLFSETFYNERILLIKLNLAPGIYIVNTRSKSPGNVYRNKMVISK